MNINFEIMERPDKRADGQIEMIKVFNIINSDNHKTICLMLPENCSVEKLANEIKEFCGDDCIAHYHFSYLDNIARGNNE